MCQGGILLITFDKFSGYDSMSVASDGRVRDFDGFWSVLKTTVYRLYSKKHRTGSPYKEL